MQLRRVRMRNLRSYESADLSFGPGTTLLSGDVGSGKTSILYAIEMALFGFAEVDPAYLVRHQAGDAEVILSLADDEHRYEFGRRFRRRQRKGRDVFELESASFSVDGATTPYSVTEIRQRAIALLGFPDNPNPRAHSDLWRWAVYVPQERMREVLAQDPEERLQTVRKALGLEQYRTAAENAQLVAAELRRMADRSEAEARGRDHLLEERPRIVLEVAERESQLNMGTTDLARENAELSAAEAHLAELEARGQAVERDRGEEAPLVDRVRADEERLRALDERGRRIAADRLLWESRRAATPDIEARRAAGLATLASLDASLAGLRREREAGTLAVAALAAAEARRASARDAITHASAEVERREQEVGGLREELSRLQAEGPQEEPPAPTRRAIAEIERAVEEVRGRVERSLGDISRWEHIASEDEELRNAGVCPRCHQKVDPNEFAVHYREVSEALGQERIVLASLRGEASKLTEERGARERYERNRQRWSDLETARGSAQERLNRTEAHLAEIRERRETLHVALRSAEDEFARLRPLAERASATVAEVARLENERAVHERRNAILATELESARTAESTVLRLLEEDGTWRGEREELARQLGERRENLARVRQRLSDASGLSEEIGSVRHRVDSARRAVAQTERTRERARTLVESAHARLAEIDVLLRERQQRLDEALRHRELATWFGNAFREAILALEHRLLARAHAEFEHDFTRFFTILVEDPSLLARSDASFSPAVEIEGEWTPAEALSGGERTALALAFRLALGQVVRAAGRLKLETLILDEPTDGFSPEQVVRMGELLDGLGLPQVLLVSHEMQLTAIADRVVRVQKEGGRSILVTTGPEGAEGAAIPAEAPSPIARRRRVRTPRLDAAGAGSS